MGTNPSPPHTPHSKAHDKSVLPIVAETPSNPGRISLNYASPVNSVDPGFKVDIVRQAVASEVAQSVVEVDYTFFRDSVLPSLDARINISTVIQNLTNHGHITQGRWTEFLDQDPYEYGQAPHGPKENEVFAHLAPVIQHIVEHSCVKEAPTATFESRPNQSPKCSVDNQQSQPDAYLLLQDHTGEENETRWWRDLATPGEFKLQDRQVDLQDDVNKVLFGMHQIMLEDPRRRFVFGYTIENTNMRIWTMNRSHALVCKPFNFIKSHTRFIHFFLSQIYADRADLGLDPTMKLYKAVEGKSPVYDITVHAISRPKDVPGATVVEEQVYRTREVINVDGAYCVLGRGTRVWSVQRVLGDVVNPQTNVLKDYWLDDDRTGEDEIVQKILDNTNPAHKPLLENFLLTPLASGNVVVGEIPDHTRDVILRGAEVPSNASPFDTMISNHVPSHGLKSYTSKPQVKSANDQMAEKKVRYHNKLHRRIVFLEECTVLSQQRSLNKVFRSLGDVTVALQIIHDSGPGWVHRDISAGNILLGPDGDQTKVSDFEYAKVLGADAAHEIRTGTPNFMAVEVDHRSYLFTPGRSAYEEEEKPVDTFALFQLRKQNGLKSADPASPNAPGPSSRAKARDLAPAPIFRYNPTHDLESVLWIAVYFVVNKETALDATSTIAEQGIVHRPLSKTQRQYANSLFHSVHKQLARGWAMRNTGTNPLDDHLRSLPPYLSTICEQLIKLRVMLCRHYEHIERDGRCDFSKSVCTGIATGGGHASGINLYSLFVSTFYDISAALEKKDVIVSPIKPEPDDPSVRKVQGSNIGSAISRGSEHSNATASSAKRAFEESVQSTSSSTKRQRKVVGAQVSKQGESLMDQAMTAALSGSKQALKEQGLEHAAGGSGEAKGKRKTKGKANAKGKGKAKAKETEAVADDDED